MLNTCRRPVKRGQEIGMCLSSRKGNKHCVILLRMGQKGCEYLGKLTYNAKISDATLYGNRTLIQIAFAICF